ncbi:glycine cleavage system protein GcvH [Candidatus Methylacidiphilum infernorum]|uniref:Glycine cleavage system H protein n=1 Tax=Methylacidiphilum infernorum (isolate V4) TaxID=481448 RepID=GCSH_METI4|nr:glycine cleavage system protein GcvH [Candidatus Methylacidiphilum infernorum]B3DZN7.1 RecName: Full=Glycine cleavage system H protein [Methylacidiphilum infernorum V4]ACD84222.1 Glycine cleavage system H protein (lipoate-binding) [Methylacidiphilum infernorum V4]
MNIPSDRLYTDTHEWVNVSGDVATVGITEHAQRELSDIVYIELPKVGERFNQKAVVGVVESVKAASDLYAPVSGEILAVNTQLVEQPSLINSNPYGEGWIFKMKMTNPDELSSLKDAEAYQELLQDKE